MANEYRGDSSCRSTVFRVFRYLHDFATAIAQPNYACDIHSNVYIENIYIYFYDACQKVYMSSEISDEIPRRCFHGEALIWR